MDNPPWGLSACIDLYECDLTLMRDALALHRFVVELCDLIQMKRHGDPQIVRFGDDPRVSGYSLTQLIETSLVSAHFVDQSRAIYLDVFSCSAYDPPAVAEFAARFFGAQRKVVQVNVRR